MKRGFVVKDNMKSGCNMDCGPKPFVTDIRTEAMRNCNYRTAVWTGGLLQMTLMSIPVGTDVGLEVHPDTDQCLYIEGGMGMAVMGEAKEDLRLRCPVCVNSCVFVPAGTWHNVIKRGFLKSPVGLKTAISSGFSAVTFHSLHRTS